MYKKRYVKYTVKSTSVKTIIVCFIFAITSFASFVLYKNFNYIFDTKQPLAEETTVEDKEVRYSTDLTKTDYYLIVYYKDNTVSIQVTEDDYNHYVPGDMYTLNVYSGILKQKYYICNN